MQTVLKIFQFCQLKLQERRYSRVFNLLTSLEGDHLIEGKSANPNMRDLTRRNRATDLAGADHRVLVRQTEKAIKSEPETICNINNFIDLISAGNE